MYPETVGRSLEEVEEIFNQGHTFSAWEIGKDVGKKTLKEVVGKSKDLEVTLFFKIFLIFQACMLTIYQLRRRTKSLDEKDSSGLVA